ncbi:MAG: methyltransferase domain-containing protein [Cyanobacteria bacterium P01_A01_bin.83]
MNYRVKLANDYLIGEGVEFGALHNPLDINREKARVLYADKYSKQALLNKFKELQKIQESVVETDIFIDLNQDNLQDLRDYNFDFFIANHVIEHLVNPLKFLENISNIMKPGSYLYLALPDKSYTFDRNRSLTTWSHLYQEYLHNTTKLSRNHLEDFILNITKDHIEDPIRKKEIYDDYSNWFKRFQIRQKHRQRSIHVHVWNQETFDDFIARAIAELKLGLTIVDRVDSSSNQHEMIYILLKK